MSYTIVRDHQQEAFENTNLVNEIKRHCKIGKVQRKVWGDVGLMRFFYRDVEKARRPEGQKARRLSAQEIFRKYVKANT